MNGFRNLGDLERRNVNHDRDPEPMGTQGLVALAIVCGTILGVVYIIFG